MCGLCVQQILCAWLKVLKVSASILGNKSYSVSCNASPVFLTLTKQFVLCKTATKKVSEWKNSEVKSAESNSKFYSPAKWRL